MIIAPGALQAACRDADKVLITPDAMRTHVQDGALIDSAAYYFTTRTGLTPRVLEQIHEQACGLEESIRQLALDNRFAMFRHERTEAEQTAERLRLKAARSESNKQYAQIIVADERIVSAALQVPDRPPHPYFVTMRREVNEYIRLAEKNNIAPWPTDGYRRPTECAREVVAAALAYLHLDGHSLVTVVTTDKTTAFMIRDARRKFRDGGQGSYAKRLNVVPYLNYETK